MEFKQQKEFKVKEDDLKSKDSASMPATSVFFEKSKLDPRAIKKPVLKRLKKNEYTALKTDLKLISEKELCDFFYRKELFSSDMRFWII